MKVFLVFILTETSLATTGYSFEFFFFWSGNYVNLVYKIFITFCKCQDTPTLFILKGSYYWHIERFFSTVCCFFGCICCSVNCMRWVSKFKIFFWRAWKLRLYLYLRAFSVALHGKFMFNTSILFRLFYLVCKLFRRPFQLLCKSVNCMSWVFES